MPMNSKAKQYLQSKDHLQNNKEIRYDTRTPFNTAVELLDRVMASCRREGKPTEQDLEALERICPLLHKSKAAPRSPMYARASSYSLDDLLEEYAVMEVDEQMNEANGRRLSGILGWWAVVDDNGAYAYFGKEEDAFRFRLAEINRRLNG